MEQRRHAPNDERESMWSVSKRFAKVYFALFSAIGTLGIAWTIWYETVHNSAGKSWYDVVDGIIQKFPPVILGAAFISFVITEALVVLYSIYRDRMEKKWEKIFAEGVAEGEARGIAEGEARGIAEGEARGKAQGVAEGIALLEDYYRRKTDAEARGEPFDEPYPGANNNNGVGNDDNGANNKNGVDNKNGADAD